jgi:hypothetical protein
VNRVGDARDSPTEQHRDPGTKQLRHELEGIGLTTNQKVAGSSPAERAVEGPTRVAFLFMWQLLMWLVLGVCPQSDRNVMSLCVLPRPFERVDFS